MVSAIQEHRPNWTDTWPRRTNLTKPYLTKCLTNALMWHWRMSMVSCGTKPPELNRKLFGSQNICWFPGERPLVC